MAYLDADLSFTTVADNDHTAQAETTQATHISDNVIDTTRIPRTIIDNGFLVIQIEVAPTTSASATMDWQLVTSAAAALSAPTIEWSSGVIATGVVTAYVVNQTIYVIKIPPVMHLRYLGMRFIIGTGALTAGSWRCFIAPDWQFLVPATP